MVHIDDILFLGDAQVALDILSSCVIHQPSYPTWTIYLFFSFLSLLVGFDMRIMPVRKDIMGLGSWESIQGFLMRHQAQLSISFGGISFYL
jgi:hypothetical protein